MKTFPMIILAGGLGTRLRSVDATRPKPMVLVHGKPFMHWLILRLGQAGFTDFILSVGYKAEHVEQYPWGEHFPQARFSLFREEHPLGTGGAVGAIFKAYPEITEAWVANGDTILETPLGSQNFSDEVHYTALAESEVFDARPNLHVDQDRVTSVGDGGKYFDGGQVYVKRTAIERYQGSVPCGLHQLVSRSFSLGKVGFTVTPGTCYDIGTPERLARFENYLRAFLKT